MSHASALRASPTALTPRRVSARAARSDVATWTRGARRPGVVASAAFAGENSSRSRGASGCRANRATTTTTRASSAAFGPPPRLPERRASPRRIVLRPRVAVVAVAASSSRGAPPPAREPPSANPPRAAWLATAARILAAFVAAVVVACARAPAAAARAAAKAAAETTATMDPIAAAAALGDGPRLIATTVALLVVYAFFAISETAITTLWPWKVREISDQEGPDSPFTLLRRDINRFLTTILIGSTVSGIASATVATEAALTIWGEGGVGPMTLALTLVTLVCCEIAPKSIAVQHAAAVARVVIPVIATLSHFVYPLGRVCAGAVNFVFSLFGIRGSAEPFVSEEELKLVLSGAAKSGQVDSDESEMIQNVLEMSETPVREVMTPLVRVVGVDQSASLHELQKIWREHRYSRVPVYNDRIDNIVGVVYSMRLLEYDMGAEMLSKVSVEGLTQKPPFYVPESMSVVKLMRELLARKTHMCIVVNEFGGTIGIATFEDCVEEIVGEIYDETDDREPASSDYVRAVKGQTDVYDVDYRAQVSDLGDALGVDIPSSALYDTVGGFTCDCFDRIPATGETILITLPAQTGYLEDDDDESDGADGAAEEEERDGKDKKEKEEVTVRPVRITVTDGGIKMVRSVQVRVNGAALLKTAGGQWSGDEGDGGGGDENSRGGGGSMEETPAYSKFLTTPGGRSMTAGDDVYPESKGPIETWTPQN